MYSQINNNVKMNGQEKYFFWKWISRTTTPCAFLLFSSINIILASLFVYLSIDLDDHKSIIYLLEVSSLEKNKENFVHTKVTNMNLFWLVATIYIIGFIFNIIYCFLGLKETRDISSDLRFFEFGFTNGISYVLILTLLNVLNFYSLLSIFMVIMLHHFLVNFKERNYIGKLSTFSVFSDPLWISIVPLFYVWAIIIMEIIRISISKDSPIIPFYLLVLLTVTLLVEFVRIYIHYGFLTSLWIGNKDIKRVVRLHGGVVQLVNIFNKIFFGALFYIIYKDKY